MQQMPIGIEDFKQLIDKNYYFVDKTGFIRQLIDGHSAVTLITRPRRFGKTLTLSMLDWFFSMEKEEKSRLLFQNLAINQAGDSYLKYRGQYPVLFISLKNIQALTWKEMVEVFRTQISNWYANQNHLLENNSIQESFKVRFRNLLFQKAGLSEMANSLYLLLAMMHQYYKKPVILLLDEYDAPIQQAWNEGFYADCITFMRQMLGSALKTNDDLEFAVVTGVLKVAKESIFSGLNNFKTCSVLDKKYSDVFGFTRQEMEKMLQDLQLTDKMPELQSWYDGYRLGNQEIYNPWSVLNYIDNDCTAKPYWVRTSGNGILKLLLNQADPVQTRMVENLLQGKSVEVTVDESVIYPELGNDPSALFTMLLMTGYLTVESQDAFIDDRYSLKIPNKEILKLYNTEILNYLAKGINKNTFDNLFMFLFRGDGEQFSWQLQRILRQFVSTYDTANKESFYHGFMLGMTALFLGSTYTVESNRESGYGRFDLAIFPKESAQAGVIMEFKAASDEARLEEKAEEALKQIETRAYRTEFTKRGITKIWKYGIAFCGKKVCVMQGA